MTITEHADAILSAANGAETLCDSPFCPECQAILAACQALHDEGARAGIEAASSPLDETALEIEDALVSEGIYMWGPDGERFERMFEVVMKQRRAIDIAKLGED